MTYHRVCYNSRTTGAGRGTGTVDPSGAHEFIPYAQFYVPPEQINKCMPIFKFDKKSLYRWFVVGAYYYENIIKR